MSAIDQEMWQDFVIEAEENMQELEPNLLLLEQDPGNTSLLNDCFRNMHSIKGAANYMGLTNTATLAHRMETLFDNVRQGNTTLDNNAMNVLFDGLDRVKQLVKEVGESHEEKSEIGDIVEKIETIIQGKEKEGNAAPQDAPDKSSNVSPSLEGEGEPDDDAELLAIFTEELRSRVEQLERLEAPVEREVVEKILADMIRVTNYIGIEDLLSGLENEADNLLHKHTGDKGLIKEDSLDKALANIKNLLAKYLGEAFSADEAPASEDFALAGEEDEELYKIFLEFIQTECKPLANIPENPDAAWLESCRKAVEKLAASAHYMDYQDVVALLEEWNERLVESLSSISDDKPFNGEPLRRLWARFCTMLPGLENYLDAAMPEETDEPDSVNVKEENEDDNNMVESLESLDAIDDMFGFESEEAPQCSELEKHDQPERSGQDGSSEAFHELDSALDNMFGEEANNEPQSIPSKPAPACEQQPSGNEPLSSTFDRHDNVSPAKLVRVDLAKVEALLEDVGELVVLRAAMLQIADDMKELYARWLEERQLSSGELKPLKQLMIRTTEQTATLEKVVHQLQDSVMKMRMLPVGTLFKRYPRMIRDLSSKLGKKIELRIFGEGTALDKRVIEHITDPMQHIVRNAVDHGIEAPDIRKKQGKPPAGTITLNAGQEGNFVVITISDDGRGLDREAIIQKAVQNGIVNGETARTMSDERVWNMIFLPGISTASSVSDTSGRGVGMDVVKNNIERLGGQISVTSSPGRGTSITMRIPLTLAIIQTLLVRVGEQNMAIPLSAVQETFRIYSDEVSSIEGFEIISLRQETLPLIRLGKVFRGTGAEDNPKKLFVVRVKMQEIEAGLAVDRFIGQQEVVIKPLSEYITDEPGFSGATILGDGTVALILDIPAVLERARNFTLKRQQIMEQAALGVSNSDSAPVFH